VRRRPEQTAPTQVLVLRDRREAVLAEKRRRGTGDNLPRYVERELPPCLSCGVAPLRPAAGRSPPSVAAASGDGTCETRR